MADKGKKAKVDEQDGSDFDSELVLAIQKLQEVQDELEKVNEEASEKVLEVEQKYSAIRRPVYLKRNDIIEGISDFWLTAFLSHPALSEILTDEDQQVFKFLQCLDVEDFKDVKSGYSITFTFRPNPYFEDSKLVKVFRFSDEGTTSISGTQPRWKVGMDYTKETNHTTGMKSFFKWFSETQQKDSSDGFHDEVAEIIREDLWPNPLKYFNNDQDDDDEDDDDDDEEFDDENAEDDEDQANGGEDDDEEDNDEDEDE